MARSADVYFDPMPPQRHVIFGAGQVGARLARLLAARGHQVRLASRSGAPAGPDIEAVRGDALDAAFCARAAEDARVLYHCMNPKYEARTWEEQLPRIQRNLVAAAGGAGARLVVLDNVYMLGRPSGRALDERSPIAPCSRKGEVRARLAADLLEAHHRGEVCAVTGRGSDFFGPGGTQTMFEGRFWRGVLGGGNAQVLVEPDTRHTYHYIPDVARGLATLGDAPDEDCGRAWMLPCAPAITTRELVGRIGDALGRDAGVRRLPRWLFKLMALAIPIFRELDEMLYQWDEDFVIDDRAFRARFGQQPTPWEQSVPETVAWAKEAFAS